MDDWHDAGVALQGAFVVFGAVALLAAAAEVPGVVDPFVLGSALFAVGFAVGSGLAFSNDDSLGVVAHLGAAVGWVLLVRGNGNGVLGWGGIALLGATGVVLCYRAVANLPVSDFLPG